MSKVQQVKERIARAFRDTPYPGDDNLVSGSISYDPEYRQVASALRGRHWSDLTRDDVVQLHESLSLLTPAALRFFLPAYMTACADGMRDMNTAPDSIIASLKPRRSRRGGGFGEIAQMFEAAEVEGIVAYLEYADELDRVEWGENVHEGQVAPVLAWWREHEAKLLSQPRHA